MAAPVPYLRGISVWGVDHAGRGGKLRPLFRPTGQPHPARPVVGAADCRGNGWDTPAPRISGVSCSRFRCCRNFSPPACAWARTSCADWPPANAPERSRRPSKPGKRRWPKPPRSDGKPPRLIGLRLPVSGNRSAPIQPAAIGVIGRLPAPALPAEESGRTLAGDRSRPRRPSACRTIRSRPRR